MWQSIDNLYFRNHCKGKQPHRFQSLRQEPHSVWGFLSSILPEHAHQRQSCLVRDAYFSGWSWGKVNKALFTPGTAPMTDQRPFHPSPGQWPSELIGLTYRSTEWRVSRDCVGNPNMAALPKSPIQHWYWSLKNCRDAISALLQPTFHLLNILEPSKTIWITQRMWLES